MASNILSRLLPSSGSDDRSVYEMMRDDERSSPSSDGDDRAGTALDEENLGQRFQDQDLEDLLASATQSQVHTESLPPSSPQKETQRQRTDLPTWASRRSPSAHSPLEDDDDVPESLLLGDDRNKFESSPPGAPTRRPAGQDTLPAPVPGPSTNRTRAQWEATRAHQRLHNERRVEGSAATRIRRGWNALLAADPKEKAMWRWANVQNLDSFLYDVYQYYLGRGIWSIALTRALNLL